MGAEGGGRLLRRAARSAPEILAMTFYLSVVVALARDEEHCRAGSAGWSLRAHSRKEVPRIGKMRMVKMTNSDVENCRSDSRLGMTEWASTYGENWKANRS